MGSTGFARDRLMRLDLRATSGTFFGLGGDIGVVGVGGGDGGDGAGATSEIKKIKL